MNTNFKSKTDQLLWELENVGPGTALELAAETEYESRMVSTMLQQMHCAGLVKRRPFYTGGLIGRTQVWLYYVDETCRVATGKHRRPRSKQDMETPKLIRAQIDQLLDSKEMTVPQLAEACQVNVSDLKVAIALMVKRGQVAKSSVARVSRGGKLHYWRKVA